MPGRFNRYIRPLCPLEENFDQRPYLDLGGSESRFAEFRDLFGEPAAWTGEGQMVVVTGDRYYGKTSFLQRCAQWLMLRAEEDGRCTVKVVDLSGRLWDLQDSDTDPMVRTFDRVLEELGTWLWSKEREAIAGKRSPAEKFEVLGDVLRSRQKPVGIVVLLPGHPDAAELSKYYSVASRGMFFLAEMFDKESIDEIGRIVDEYPSWRVRFNQLALGALRPGDPLTFVRWMNRESGAGLKASREIVDFFEEEISERGLGVGAMLKQVWGGAEVAHKESELILRRRHIEKFYDI